MQKLFVVDDLKAFRTLLRAGLETDYAIECFDSAESCLQGMANALPDLLLLDVDLPGLSGFDLCRQLRSETPTRRLPIIFTSGLDDLESRIEGYEAGGTDFLAKPLKLPEVRKKVAVALQWVAEHQALSSQISDGELLTSLIMSNLDEYAALIGFLRQLNDCNVPEDLIEPVFKLLRAYHLDGIVQLRGPEFEHTVNSEGESTPMELSVVNHVRGLERIFSFGKRTAYNFERITILVNTMPLEDAELCGRLRDHLAIAAETANAKLAALEAFANERRIQNEIGTIVHRLNQAIRQFAARYDQVHSQSGATISQLLDKLLQSFAPLALSEWQEQQVLDLVEQEVNNLIALYDFADDNQSALENLLEHLSGLLAAKAGQE